MGGTNVTLLRVVRAEWTRLLTLRSTWVCAAVAVVVTIGLGAAFGYGYHLQVQGHEAERSVSGAVGAAFLAIDLPALVLGVLGMVRITGEYGSGSIRSTLLAVPRRTPVLLAKALVLAAAVAAVMVPACLLAFVAAQAAAGPDGYGVGEPGVVRAILGAAAYPVALALIGLGVGAMVRHTAAGVTLLVVVILVIPAMMMAGPERVTRAVGPYLPISAAQAVYALAPEGPIRLLSPERGLVVMLGYVLLALLGGLLVLRRRDA
jgi:ABC-2 type transport system permease protein